MFEHNFFKLNAGVADGLEGIKGLKTFVVRLQQYEYAAKLREIEKLLESAAKQLSFYTCPVPHKGLTPKGKSFYNHLFNYCIAKNWKNIPGNFTDLFLERKEHLNGLIEFNDNTSRQLIDLNKKLAAEEDHIQEFFNFIQYVVSVKGIKNCLDEEPSGSLTIKCYTQSNYYEFTMGGFNPELPFYQQEFSLSDFISSMPAFYAAKLPPPAFLESLPLKFRDEKICLLFSLLATDGLLAWDDFLNITRFETELNVKYKFTTD